MLTYAGLLVPVALVDAAGNAQGRQVVDVLNLDGTDATVYTDAARTPLTGSVASDPTGNVSGVYAEPGVYRLRFSVLGVSYEVQSVASIDPREITDLHTLVTGTTSNVTAETAARTAADLAEQSARVAADAAEAASRAAAVSSNAAGDAAEATARTNADTAEAAARAAADAAEAASRATADGNEVTARAAAVSAEASARTAADAAINASLALKLDATVAAAAYSPIAQVAPGVKLYNPKGLRRWEAALGDAINSYASIACFGDSISVGIGADNLSGQTTANDATYYKDQGWIGQLRRLFAITYADPGEGFVFIGSLDIVPRTTYTGTAAGYGGAGPMENGLRITANATPGTATIDLGTCTEVDFWTWDGGGGVCSVQIDGASTGFSLDGGASGANTFNAGNASSTGTTYTKHTITGLTLGTHTLKFTGATGSVGLYVAAVSARKIATGVRVHRIAKSGATTPNMLGLDSGYISNVPAQQRQLATIGVVPTAHLVIIALGVNDFGAQNATATTNAQPGTTPTTYKANLQAAVDQAVAAGACVLLLGEPRQNAVSYPSPMTYTEQDYQDKAKEIALATDHCAYIDVNDLWGSNVLGQQLDFYATNSVHPKRKGHGSIARLVHKVLTTSFGFNAPTT